MVLYQSFSRLRQFFDLINYSNSIITINSKFIVMKHIILGIDISNYTIVSSCKMILLLIIQMTKILPLSTFSF